MNGTTKSCLLLLATTGLMIGPAAASGSPERAGVAAAGRTISGADGAAAPDLIVLLDQHRNISAHLEVTAVQGEWSAYDGDSAPDFGPFASEVVADLGMGLARASQDSAMGEFGFSSFGRVSVRVLGGRDCDYIDEYTVWGAADSHFAVSFELERSAEMTCRFRLEPVDGEIVARLDGPEETIHFSPEPVRQAYTLMPGRYDLLVDLRISAMSGCPYGSTFTVAMDYAFRLERCPEDIDRSGAVDFGDILAVIGAWGRCGGCAEDLDLNALVDVRDLLLVLASWGPCD